MPASRFHLGKDGALSASGHFPKGEAGQELRDPRRAIPRLYAILEGMQGHFRKAVAGDGRIIGVERSRLLEFADQAVVAVIAVIRCVAEAPTVDLDAQGWKPRPLILHCQDEEWSLEGSIGLRLSSHEGGFRDFYRTEYAPRLRNFLEEYRRAAADGQLSDAERAAILPSLRELLGCAIKLYFLIYHMRIND